jgi:hypothetical protein
MHPSRLRNVFCWTLVALMSDEAGGGGPYHLATGSSVMILFRFAGEV